MNILLLPLLNYRIRKLKKYDIFSKTEYAEVIRIITNNKFIELIDKYGVDGDFVESQAFAYLAIRSFLKLPISYTETTGVAKPCTGGVIIKV